MPSSPAVYPVCCQSAYCGRGSCTTRERPVEVSPGVWERRAIPEVCPNLPILQAWERAQTR